MSDEIKSIGQYQIKGVLGKGGMATVYRAYQDTLNREVAIKVISPQFADDPAFRERFSREARSIASLDHPNILQIYDYGEEDGLPYIVMPILRNQTLRQLLEKGPLDPHTCAAIIEQLGSALQYAHDRRLIHRDVKPSNILMNQQNRAILSDFGIARLVNDTKSLTMAGAGIGTPDYMSPEQAMGETLDGRSDEYSLAVMLYEMLTGVTPFRGETPLAVVMGHLQSQVPDPRQINPNITPRMVEILQKALAKRPEERFRSVGEFASEFSRAAQEIPPGSDWAATNLPTAPVSTRGDRPSSSGIYGTPDIPAPVPQPTTSPGDTEFVPEPPQPYGYSSPGYNPLYGGIGPYTPPPDTTLGQSGFGTGFFGGTSSYVPVETQRKETALTRIFEKGKSLLKINRSKNAAPVNPGPPVSGTTQYISAPAGAPAPVEDLRNALQELKGEVAALREQTSTFSRQQYLDELKSDASQVLGGLSGVRVNDQNSVEALQRKIEELEKRLEEVKRQDTPPRGLVVGAQKPEPINGAFDPTTMTQTLPGTPRVFISYSRKDKKWLERLQIHLKPLERQFRLEVWDDTRITPGTKWKQQIKHELERSTVAILLISPDFLASDFIADYELAPLLKAAENRGAIILPVIVNHCWFAQSPLAQFQAVNDPSRPLSVLGTGRQDATFAKIVRTVWETTSPNRT